MKITNKIFDNINESDIDENSKSAINIFASGIKDLINDEKEAYSGYNKFLSDLSEKVTGEIYEDINEVITHIIEEEQEHIEELKKLYKALEPKLNR